MRYCPQCYRLTPDDPLYCNRCGATYDGRLCPARHLNPRNALVCAQCGSRELSTPAPRSPLWLRPALVVLPLVPGAILALLLVMDAAAMIDSLSVNGQLPPRLVVILLLLALLWWIYVYFYKFIHYSLRSLWTNRKKD